MWSAPSPRRADTWGGGGGGAAPRAPAGGARPDPCQRRPELPGGEGGPPAALAIAEGGIRRVLAKLGVLAEAPARSGPPTRLMQVRGQEYYCYAPEPGLFEPLVDLGADVEAGTPAGVIHSQDTPWREPALAHFSRAGTGICKRL